MDQYAGIDVSLESSSVCVLDSVGKVVREARVASEPGALIAWFRGLDAPVTRIGVEAGPLSQWLYAVLREAGFAVKLLETRQVADAFRSMPVKTDRKDARGIAQLLRLGWFKPVHCKSLGAQEARALLTARRQLQAKRHDVEMSIRGILRGFGLKVGKTTPKTFEHRVRELVDDHPTLTTVVEALLRSRGVLDAEFRKLDKTINRLAAVDSTVGLLTSAPGVGVLVALTYKTAVRRLAVCKHQRWAAGGRMRFEGARPPRFPDTRTNEAVDQEQRPQCRGVLRCDSPPGGTKSVGRRSCPSCVPASSPM
jgi:transposase